MSQLPLPSSITISEFRTILQRYPLIVSFSHPSNQEESTLKELDGWRRDDLPRTIRSRTRLGDSYITKDEIIKLLKCKMKRGKFRPTLLPLLNQNSETSVKSTTQNISSHYSSCGNTKHNDLYDLNSLTRDITHLTKNLKGVGPALASYIRPFLLPESIAAYTPVFSDEAARWILNTEGKDGKPRSNKNEEIWRSKLTYSLKEYSDYVQKVWDVNKRLQDVLHEAAGNGGEIDDKTDDAMSDITPEAVEMVGWVLGKEGQGWKAVEKREEEEASERQSPLVKQPLLNPPRRIRKRKLDSASSEGKDAKVKVTEARDQEKGQASPDGRGDGKNTTIRSRARRSLRNHEKSK